ncbi:siroheme synthase CysG [Maricurvus nonylphenolicus]|uniref:siroheme synthase CysG n=1 Tax=Maricurvus nonylphenolicus TaxID=1008307 RepID=UPI0036F240F1
MDYLPLFFDLRKQPCLLVGGGTIAFRKARLLVRAGAQLHVVALQICDQLQELITENDATFALKAYDPSDLDNRKLVIAATDKLDLNEQVSTEAKSRNIPVNVVDNPELCTFITPAIIDRSPLMIAVSSGGEAPVLARQTRAKLESLIPSGYGRLAKLASRWRDKVKDAFADGDMRRRFWEEILSGTVAELTLNGNDSKAEELIEQKLAEADVNRTGEVYLVGAGPGDPELLTLRALRLMQQAEVVLYDRLVSEGVMDLVRRDADLIYVGKKRDKHAVPQGEINQMLVDLAKQGKRVLRLKGGDPFIFGRGGEEIELLAENSVPFQVVPGITAASGCASYAGIPLTHRDHAQSVRFITGHLRDNTINMNWSELVEPSQTLVFYMGLKGLPAICDGLIKAGRSPQTPAALIEKGTREDQRVFCADLSSLPGTIAAQEVHAPTLLIVGDVVSLHEKLSWFG